MASPVPVKANSAVPRTFWQIHRSMYFMTQAQPMMVKTESPSRMFHPM